MSHPSRAADRERTFGVLYEAVYPDLMRFVQRRVHEQRRSALGVRLADVTRSPMPTRTSTWS